MLYETQNYNLQRSFFEMLKQQNLNLHRRNKSQLMNYASSQPPKPKKKTNSANNNSKKRPLTSNNKKALNPTLVNTLLNKSVKKINRKQILVEDIDQVPDQQCTDDFFCFGKGYANNKFRQIEPHMEEIVEVPDTGSYSQRNTDQDHHNYNENKENIKDMANHEEIQEKFFRLSKNQDKTNATQNATIALLSHRLVNNCSRRSSNNSQRSDCSQTHSTVQLSRQKSKLSRSKSRGKNDSKNQLKIMRQKTAKMEKNIKMIWQCMGQIWENSRTCKQVSQRNSDNVNDLSHRVFQNQKMLLDLKLDLGRRYKDISFRG